MTIRVEGLKEAVKKLNRLGVEDQDLKAGFKKAGNVVVDESRTLVPVLSGKLLNSIRASNTKNKSIVRAGGARIPYAGVIHWGGYHDIEATHFLTEALDNKRAQVLTAIEEELDALIKRLNLN
jgi:HK97 gp10 family phage protein